MLTITDNGDQTLTVTGTADHADHADDVTVTVDLNPHPTWPTPVEQTADILAAVLAVLATQHENATGDPLDVADVTSTLHNAVIARRYA